MLILSGFLQGAVFGYVLSKTQLTLGQKIPLIVMNSLLLGAVVAGALIK